MRFLCRLLRWGMGFVFLLGEALSAHAQNLPIVADLSQHLVAITTGFSGTDVLLFGATDGPGDVIMVVRGPSSDVTIRRKGRIGPVWANLESITFQAAPSFYLIASTKPVTDLLDVKILKRHQIGVGNLDFKTDAVLPSEEEQLFRDALTRLKVENNLYAVEEGTISTMANNLFRADLYFPSNVPTGNYTVEVYLIRDHEIKNAEMTPLVVSKVGLNAEITWFAQENGVYYGLSAIVFAALAGWIASVLFRGT